MYLQNMFYDTHFKEFNDKCEYFSGDVVLCCCIHQKLIEVQFKCTNHFVRIQI